MSTQIHVKNTNFTENAPHSLVFLPRIARIFTDIFSRQELSAVVSRRD